MKKLLILLICLFPFSVFALDYPALYSKVAIVYDKTDNQVLYELNSKEETSIASLTKIVTTITAIENIKDLNKEVTITKEILDTVDPAASIAGLKVGDKLTYLDLLYASMVPSGADATNSLAILSSSSISNFVAKMNNLVKKLNLKHTHFVNVTGLDETGHYSSASDMQKLLSYALENKIFKQIYITKEYQLSNGLKVKTTIDKYNKNLNLDVSKILGSKTGFTYAAGYCLSSYINHLNHEIIIINLNAPYEEKIAYHLIDNVTLIDFVTENYQMQVLSKKNDLLTKLPVKFSNIESYDIITSKDIAKFLPNDYDKSLIEVKYDGIKKLSFLNHKGSKIGIITYYYDGERVESEIVYLNQKINLNIVKLFKCYFYVPIALTMIIIVFKKKKLSKGSIS